MALSLGLPIVSKSWITESYLGNQILSNFTYLTLDADNFPLIDCESEAKYECDLQKSMQLAKSKKLLDGVSILSTPKVIPGPTTLRMLIDAAGGTVCVFVDNMCSILKNRRARNSWSLQRRRTKILYII